ncbi:RND superfamily putative drug exporter [Actinomadura pelletieri DSM 43383]|uniref:RND superfamily putative drug exporter n=1 Tax=Actinomadura pelletieri DSM 43383 TaxID=1120940 RepID=A0A495QTZ1_9ACTN|nr:MMPL family transporter [Actinomadura pelletieri]RKS76984.1 RND superfamily putative drug exporter [Actinomadura pelletieri DSM 43383]
MLERLGRFCHRHRRPVALAWLVAAIALFVVGNRVFDRFSTEFHGAHMESVAGSERLSAARPQGPRVSAVLAGRPVDDPGVRRAVDQAVTDVRRIPHVAVARGPYGSSDRSLVAPDGRALLIHVDLAKNLSDGTERETVDAVAARLEDLRRTGAEVHLGGSELVGRAFAEQSRADVEHGETVALPLTLLVMVFVFGGLIAAGLPILAALGSIAGGLAALYGFSHLMDLDPDSASVTTVLGLGVSIDYALLMVNRYREERGAGLAAEDAVGRMMATAGRTVAWSAMTVCASVAALFIFDIPTFQALGAAALSVVLVALVVSLTLVPALLGLARRRIKPSRTTEGSGSADDGLFAKTARATRRRPVLTLVGVAAVLLLAGVPFVDAEPRLSRVQALPADAGPRRFEETVAKRFPGRTLDPVLIVAAAPPEKAAPYAASVRAERGVTAVGSPEPLSPGWSLIEVHVAGDPQGQVARDLVKTLRAERPDFRTWVTGSAAVLEDHMSEIRRALPWAAGWIAVAMFVLLFAMTGSLLVPIKAMVVNTLSLGASFGVLVWVFQDGHGAGLLGFTSSGGIEVWVPVLVFTFAFGLSMDYEVFLLSRIKELYDQGTPTDLAVEHGLQRTARIITSAALLMIIVFAGFATGELLGIKELGVALAVAVAVDATLVRCLLVPAAMTLLGESTWWAPRPLRRLHHRLRLGESG